MPVFSGPPAAGSPPASRFPLLALAGVILFTLASLVLQGPGTAFLSESGGVEIATVVLLLVTAAWGRWPGAGPALPWSVVGVIAVLGLRELDVHDWYFEPGLLQIRIFSAPVPVWQKAVSAVVMLALLALLLAFARQGTAPFLRALRGRQAWAIWLTLGTGLAGVASLFDGIGRKLAPYGVTVPPPVETGFVALEEIMEVVFALCVVVAIARWRAGRLSRS